jgi:hypothetical protein
MEVAKVRKESTLQLESVPATELTAMAVPLPPVVAVAVNPVTQTSDPIGVVSLTHLFQ